MFRLYCPQDRGFLTLYMVFENSYNHKTTYFQKKNAGKVYVYMYVNRIKM